MIRLSIALFLLLASINASAEPLSNWIIDWELVPGGIIEPKLNGNSTLDALLPTFSEQELVECLHQRDQFVFGYVMLFKMKHPEVHVRAKQEVGLVSARYGELTVRIHYNAQSVGFNKSVEYPLLHKEFMSVNRHGINTGYVAMKTFLPADRWSGLSSITPTQAAESLPLKELESTNWLNIDRIKPVFYSGFPRLEVDKEAAQRIFFTKQLHPDRCLAVLGNPETWIPMHAALSQATFPNNQSVHASLTGFDVNLNGLTIELVRHSNSWQFRFPNEARDHIQARQFWELQLVEQDKGDRSKVTKKRGNQRNQMGQVSLTIDPPNASE